jgi:AraC-like DNA-binding protein
LVRCTTLSGASPRIQRFVGETIVLGFWRMLELFGAEPSQVQVNFAYPAPLDREPYTKWLHGTERFDQPFTGVVFERALMQAPSRHKDDDVHTVLRSVAQRRILRLMGATPYAVRVRELLVRQGPSGANMDKVARLLGLSARTLRRRLAAEDRTYEQLFNEASAIVAKQLLATSMLSIQEASYRLGFSSPSAFHRAFKRWTGMTPLEYRAQHVARAGAATQATRESSVAAASETLA